MIKSLRTLFISPFNKKHPFFAVYRFFYWKLIRALKLKNVKYTFWENRIIFLSYNSFQCMWLMYNYIVDWEEFNLIKNYTQPHDQLADIGANVGYYSMWMSKFISASGKVHAFEPDENNFKLFTKNMEVNNTTNVINLNKMAISDIDGQLNFTKGLDEKNHISLNTSENATTIISEKIDTYMTTRNIPVFTYMKIDVEGFEYSVLKGAHEALLNKRIEILQLEINNSITNSGTTVDLVLRLINQYNYRLCRYDVKANKLFPIEFSNDRENYFVVYDPEKANARLKENFSQKSL